MILNKIIILYPYRSLCCEMSQQLGDRDLVRGDLETDSDIFFFVLPLL